jgi:ADP-heptose:LPS heptosyltransferase
VQAPPAAPLPADDRSAPARRYVVLHVPTLVRYKLWPIEHQVTLVRALLGDGWQVLLSGGHHRPTARGPRGAARRRRAGRWPVARRLRAGST